MVRDASIPGTALHITDLTLAKVFENRYKQQETQGRRYLHR
jgi:hypothetical protein